MDTIKNNATGLSGLDQLRALMQTATPPPIGVTLGLSNQDDHLKPAD